MACIDIYQALTRTDHIRKDYRMKTCDILDDMAQKGFIDSTISNKIREFFNII